MNINKILLTMAVAIVVTGCQPNGMQQPSNAVIVETAEPQEAQYGSGEVISIANVPAFNNSVVRHTDATNSVVCYTVRNGNGGYNISCVKL